MYSLMNSKFLVLIYFLIVSNSFLMTNHLYAQSTQEKDSKKTNEMFIEIKPLKNITESQKKVVYKIDDLFKQFSMKPMKNVFSLKYHDVIVATVNGKKAIVIRGVILNELRYIGPKDKRLTHFPGDGISGRTISGEIFKLRYHGSILKSLIEYSCQEAQYEKEIDSVILEVAIPNGGNGCFAANISDYKKYDKDEFKGKMYVF